MPTCVLTIASLALALPLTAIAHGYFPPKFGGVMSEGGEISVELVALGDRTVLYVEDHGTPLLTEGASGAFGVFTLGQGERVFAMTAAGNNTFHGPPTILQVGDRIVATAQFADGNVMFVRFKVRPAGELPPGAMVPPPFARPFTLPHLTPASGAAGGRDSSTR